MATTRPPLPMDTPYSWLIFFSAFMVAFVTFGQLMSFGIYYVTFSEYFHLDKKTTGLIGAVCFAVTNVIGPVAGVLQRRFGARVVIMIGGILSSIGMTASYFATEFWHILISYGAVVGLGYGLAANPAMSILPEYFEKHRYLVTTLLSMGGSLGTLVLAPFNLFMIETYTWRGSMLINAGICLQLVVLGSILRSRVIDRKASLGELLRVSVFKDCRYVMVLLDGAMFGGAGFVLYSTLTELAIVRGLSTWEAATLISITSLSTTISRVLAAFLSTIRSLDRIALYTFMSLFGCAGLIGCVFSYNFWAFAVSLLIFGFSFGIKVSQLFNVIMDLIGVHGIAVGIGYFMFALGLGGFVVPLMAGWIADQFGIDKALHLMLMAILIGFICCCVILILRRRDKKRMKANQNNNVEDEQAEADALNVAVVPIE